MGASWIKIGFAAGLLAGAAQGDTLYERDGITLAGTVRLVTREAATCQVHAANESPEVYERTKANHGQPLHVWRLDFAARNGSGRRLEQLTAHFRIEAEWPPCTNWTGLGQYPGPVQWAGSFETIQRTGGMQLGEEAGHSVFLLAFHDQEPRFARWQVDYRFAAGAPPSPLSATIAGSSAGNEGGSRLPVASLPPEIMADLYLLRAEQAVRGGDPAAVRAAMERVQALQSEHGTQPAPEDHFRHARAWEAAGELERAIASAVRYLVLQGRDADRYTEALELMNRAESAQTGSLAEALDKRRDGPEETQMPPNVRTGLAGGTAGAGSCLIPGYPRPPTGVASLGFSWCPASVSMQFRAFALQAAGAQCAIVTGSSSTPEQIQARRQEIKAVCDRLVALGVPNCRCPPGLRR